MQPAVNQTVVASPSEPLVDSVVAIEKPSPSTFDSVVDLRFIPSTFDSTHRLSIQPVDLRFIERGSLSVRRRATEMGNTQPMEMGAAESSKLEAVADYLSRDLPYKLSEDDIFLTVGCTQAIQTILTVVTNPKSNILLPKPGFPYYEAVANSCHLDVRHFDLLPDKNWEADLDAIEALADENTVAMVIINPGNPCGNIFTSEHLEKVAKTAKKLGILVISDEVYDHLAFGKKPFVPMGTFGSITPVVTLGSISKRWIVPGWRLGWLAINDPNGILKEHGIVDCIMGHLSISCDPSTIIQGAIPDILGKTKSDFFLKIINIIKESANICYEGLADVPGLICPSKPEGSMFVMVKLDLSVFEDIKDDLDFSLKLAKEESVIILPGITVGLKNWLRITFAIEPSALEDGIKRLKAFCERHSDNP
ncbi:hypothetical protein R6Q57_024264 [Mikania cordata]